MANNYKSWTDKLDDAPIVCTDPIDAHLRDVERRYHELCEMLGEDHPAATATRFHLDHLLEARNRAVKLDRWLDLRTIAAIANGSYASARRKVADLPDDVKRRNGINGKIEVHQEAVAELLDVSLDTVRGRREDMQEET